MTRWVDCAIITYYLTVLIKAICHLGVVVDSATVLLSQCRNWLDLSVGLMSMGKLTLIVNPEKHF